MDTAQNIKTTSKFLLKPTPIIPGLPAVNTSSQILSDPAIIKPKELIAGLLHKGTKGVLASGSKAGKTWILLDLSLSVATGTKFLRYTTEQGKVLFINFEIQPAFIRDRLTAVMKRRGLNDAGDLHFWNLRGKTADFEALAWNIIKQVEGKGYALIVLDPIYKAMTGRSENMAGGVGALCDQIERIVEKSGAAVVYSHHFTKGNAAKKKSIDRMSGSGVFARDADTIITLTEHEEPDCYTAEMTLRNLPPQSPFVIQWDFPVMVERPDLDPARLRGADDAAIEKVQPMLELLLEKPLTTAEWEDAAKLIGYSRPTFFRYKAQLKNDGHLKFYVNNKTWALLKQ